MKNLLIVLLFIVSLTAFAQEENSLDFKKNEFKGNALFLVLGTLELTYERLINEESGFGLSVHVPFTNESDINFSVTPYYRFYFGKKPAAGFFAEGFGMLNQVEDIVYEENILFSERSKTITDFAFGLGLGGKWITKRGVIFEINAGVGRNLFNEYNDNRDFEFIGRGGITVGYRF